MAKTKDAFDAIVLGGGPGGATAAGFIAKRGLRVAVFEKEKFPRYHIGESLLPATTMGLFAKLGVKEKVDGYGFPRKLGGTFRWGADPKPWTFQFYRTDEVVSGGAPAAPEEPKRFLHAWQVRRAELDRILLEHAKSLGAEVHEESACAAVEGLDEDMKSVVVDSKGRRRTYRAPCVIDASGRGSLARHLFGERVFDPFFANVAVFGYFTGGGRLDEERKGNIFCEAFSDGWFWYIPLSDELTSVGVVMAKETHARIKSKPGAEILASMIKKAPYVKRLLKHARPCKKAPYDKIRVEADYSYAHTEFARGGVFLAGDAACFIDPVFSSGVHLATYAGFLAAEAVVKLRGGETTLKEASAEYDRAYRREYRSFHRFLVSFYEMHKDTSSYFWEARKVLKRRHGSDLDAFISIVSGTSTTGGALLDGGYASEIRQGKSALDTLVKTISGKKVTNKALQETKVFMESLRESRHRFIK
ncbi:MAG: tryptophan 7-halogenase [Proteobacteria bacterium]|nr:tryptophan 7-halogenase [Pseudomonadota bacterium]